MPDDRIERGLPSFIEIPPFGTRWARLGLTDVDLNALQSLLLDDPKAGAVIRGTDGIRKVRFASPESRRGKSGSYRVFYLDVPEHGLVALWAVIDKTESDNLTPAERNILAGRVAAFLAALDERTSR